MHKEESDLLREERACLQVPRSRFEPGPKIETCERNFDFQVMCGWNYSRVNNGKYSTLNIVENIAFHTAGQHCRGHLQEHNLQAAGQRSSKILSKNTFDNEVTACKEKRSILGTKAVKARNVSNNGVDAYKEMMHMLGTKTADVKNASDREIDAYKKKKMHMLDAKAKQRGGRQKDKGDDEVQCAGDSVREFVRSASAHTGRRGTDWLTSCENVATARADDQPDGLVALGVGANSGIMFTIQ